mmetsp:Transcript_9296/g.40588  ORF Transcript_9296/g.40588 Transcript_9296/m.40588 type:complete len:89 (+) Transcript_9296:69-335(+)
MTTNAHSRRTYDVATCFRGWKPRWILSESLKLSSLFNVLASSANGSAQRGLRQVQHRTQRPDSTSARQPSRRSLTSRASGDGESFEIL